ncbi:MAG: alpha/beta hydrolase [Leptospiraceae bacterium]|nr:alpha/beta hydrolase [Leptospiraceae bacterium]
MAQGSTKRFFKFIIFLTIFNISSCFITRKLIFIPVGKARLPDYKGKLIKVKNKDEEVIGYFSKNGKKLIVGFHGQHGSIHSFSAFGNRFYNSGFSVLLVEYPGYGLASKSSVSESNIYNSSEIIIKEIQKEYGFSLTNTILMGYSLGTGVAVEMAKRNLGEKVLLFAPYTSIPAVAEDRYIRFLPHMLIWDRFDSLKKAKSISKKVIIVHGEKDTVVPYYMGEKLNDEFPNSTLVSLPGYTHNLYPILKSKTFEKIIKLIK